MAEQTTQSEEELRKQRIGQQPPDEAPPVEDPPAGQEQSSGVPGSGEGVIPNPTAGTAEP